MEYIENRQECKVRNISAPLYDSQKWIKFVGIGSIASGVISALSILGIIYAWLPIWMGVLLFRAAEKVEQAHESKDEQALMEALKKLKTYFVINGVLLLVYIIIALLGMLSLGFILYAFSGKLPWE